MDSFGAGMGGGRGGEGRGEWGDWWAKTSPLPKICYAYPAMMKLGTIIT